MVQIIPAILASTDEQYKKELDLIEASKLFEWVHIDLIDNKFVQNQTVGLEVINKYPTSLKKEAHLMIEDPGELVEGLIDAGFERLIIHKEISSEKLNSFKEKIDGEEVFVAFNPETAFEDPKFPGVLIMGVHPGFGGQEFIPEVIDKIKQAKNMGQKIGVDGGINENNAKLIVNAGADYLVIGSHLLRGNIDENLEKIWEALRT